TETIPVTYPSPTSTTISQCDTSESFCCNSIGAANTLPGASAVLNLLNIALDPVTAIVGLGCSPISIGTGGGANCAQQPVCCTNDSFNGLVSFLFLIPIYLPSISHKYLPG
ncbi:hypothetical protein M422DRAFT_188752, partial [Sphaerobolus stellatus SS14]